MKKKRFWLVGLLLMLGFIWGHSLMPRAISAGESGLVTRFLARFLPFLADKENLVRKMAHLGEFLLLGLCLEQLICPDRFGKGLKAKAQLGLAQGLGMLAAFIDETLQIFSGRGPLIQDVWLDSLGVLLGLGLGVFLRKIPGRKSRSRKASR